MLSKPLSRLLSISATAVIATLGATSLVSALSLAPDQPWSPETVTGNVGVSYTGNSLILDATSGKPTLDQPVYPYNQSRATLVRDPSAAAVVSAHVIWGIAQGNSSTNIQPESFDEILLTLPNETQYSVNSDDYHETVSTNSRILYFIADVSHLPIGSGEYAISLPQLSSAVSSIHSAGWGLTAIDHNPNLPLSTVTPHWYNNSNPDKAISPNGAVGFTVDPSVTISASPFEFPRTQLRVPASGFTQLQDVALGEKLSSGTQFRLFTPEQGANFQLPYWLEVSTSAQRSLTGSVKFLDSTTRQPLSVIHKGDKVTVTVQIENNTDESFHDAKVSLVLPQYLQYKRGSLIAPPGTINSGNYTDSNDEDPAYFAVADSELTWRPGNTAASNTSRPYLLKPEDATQELSFQAYIGDFPDKRIPRLTATIEALDSNGSPVTTIAPTLDGLVATDAYSGGNKKTDIAVSAELVPRSSTYWNLQVYVTNPSPTTAYYTWTTTLPSGAEYDPNAVTHHNCVTARLTSAAEELTCVGEAPLAPGAILLDEIAIRVDDRPDRLEWGEVSLTPNNSAQDTNGLDNTSQISVRIKAFTHAPVARPDIFESSSAGALTGAAFNLLTNDVNHNSPVSVVIEQSPTHGRVEIDKQGNIEYAQRTKALIQSDSFTYYLENEVSGLRSKPASVTIKFPFGER